MYARQLKRNALGLTDIQQQVLDYIETQDEFMTIEIIIANTSFSRPTVNTSLQALTRARHIQCKYINGRLYYARVGLDLI